MFHFQLVNMVKLNSIKPSDEWADKTMVSIGSGFPIIGHTPLYSDEKIIQKSVLRLIAKNVNTISSTN